MARFEIGKIYETVSGLSTVRIVDNKYRGQYLLGVMVAKNKQPSEEQACSFLPNTGAQVGNPAIVLVSDEPSDEEIKLIHSIGNMVENGRIDNHELLKIIRQLRTK